MGHSQHLPGSGLKTYEAEHNWLTTVRLPSYTPDLNPVEAVWSLVCKAIADTAFDTSLDIDRKLRRALHRIHTDPRLGRSLFLGRLGYVLAGHRRTLP
ncbi:transposase [Streptomyces chartreusis]|uniref:transposase n=1 Tax=Streptomyces chartreusis TaxID=1969 RepID=UPI0036AF6416